MTRLATVLNRSLARLARDAEDEAAVELARHYAASIDSAARRLTPKQIEALKGAGLTRMIEALDELEALKLLGPKLLDALAQLGMTPRARNAVMKGGTAGDGASDKIDELSSRRQRRAAALDASAS